MVPSCSLFLSGMSSRRQLGRDRIFQASAFDTPTPGSTVGSISSQQLFFLSGLPKHAARTIFSTHPHCISVYNMQPNYIITVTSVTGRRGLETDPKVSHLVWCRQKPRGMLAARPSAWGVARAPVPAFYRRGENVSSPSKSASYAAIT